MPHVHLQAALTPGVNTLETALKSKQHENCIFDGSE